MSYKRRDKHNCRAPIVAQIKANNKDYDEHIRSVITFNEFPTYSIDLSTDIQIHRKHMFSRARYKKFNYSIDAKFTLPSKINNNFNELIGEDGWLSGIESRNLNHDFLLGLYIGYTFFKDRNITAYFVGYHDEFYQGMTKNCHVHAYVSDSGDKQNIPHTIITNYYNECCIEDIQVTNGILMRIEQLNETIDYMLIDLSYVNYATMLISVLILNKLSYHGVGMLRVKPKNLGITHMANLIAVLNRSFKVVRMICLPWHEKPKYYLLCYGQQPLPISLQTGIKNYLKHHDSYKLLVRDILSPIIKQITQPLEANEYTIDKEYWINMLG